MNFGYSIQKNRTGPNKNCLSDESMVYKDTDSHFVWWRNNELNRNAAIKKEKFSASIMVWEIVSQGFESEPNIIKGTMVS